MLIDDSTPGYYNDALGEVLDGTSPMFPEHPCPGTFSICDPTIVPAGEPDLRRAAALLGPWLSEPPAQLTGHWSGPQAIPPTWTVGNENAIVYEIHGGACGVRDARLEIGGDNGVFVWVDGVYSVGAVEPGAATPGEYKVSLGDLRSGVTPLQVLREDHGGLTGFTIRLTGIMDTTGDADGDGFGDGAESAAGSDPCDPQSVPPVAAGFRAAEDIDAMARDPRTALSAVRPLQQAVSALIGNKGGAASNGAIDKLSSGDLVAGVEKFSMVPQSLDQAKAADPALDVAWPADTVTLAGRTVAANEIDRAEAADPTAPEILTATAQFDRGEALRDEGKRAEALEMYKKAVGTVKGVG